MTFCDAMDCNMPGFPFLHYLLEFARPYVHWVNDAIQQSRPLLTPLLPAFDLSQHQGLFQWVSSSHQVAKVLELQLQHQYSKEYSRLISFRIDWFDLLAVQGTLKIVFSNTAVGKHSAFFMVQFSHLYMTTGKTIVLTIQIIINLKNSWPWTMQDSEMPISLCSWKSTHYLHSWCSASTYSTNHGSSSTIVYIYWKKKSMYKRTCAV